MAEITLENVRKVFADGTEAVQSFDVQIPDGSFMVLVGPSGCGKTTVLRMVAGLEDMTDGTIRIGDRIVNDIPPGARDVAMVFQNYALYPHMTVYENMALSLKIHKVKRDEMNRRVREAAAGQFLLVQAVETSGIPVTERAAGVWNLLSGAVQALAALDLVDAATAHRLLGPVLSTLGPSALGS